MKDIEMTYSPYKMETTLFIDGINVCEDHNYNKFKEFIDDKIPMQTWIEPIKYKDWNGFVNEISDPDNNDKVELTFHGRRIDFEDLKRAIEEQNAKRSKGTRVIYKFNEPKKFMDDKEMAKNIEYVVNQLKSDAFKKLVQERSGALVEKYNDLDKNYELAKSSEFYIVFAGMYSSGKSTILNTIIRHNILPTSDSTCTSKNCRIVHDSSLGEKVSLHGLREIEDEQGNIKRREVAPMRIFKSDEECAAYFKEICPNPNEQEKNTDEKYFDVNMMELGVNLSHLYPESVNEKQFRIVLIDTPGANSAESSENGHNEHADVALKAIADENKPMIVYCDSIKTCEQSSTFEFMAKILEMSKKDKGSFSDRFLFLLNQSDTCDYNPGETAEDRRKSFAKKLTNADKYGLSEENELRTVAENASHFVPRIFMTSALMAQIVYYGKDKYNPKTRGNFDTFVYCVKEEDNYRLSSHCDIPGYRKAEIDAEFQKAMEDGDEITATELQTGMNAVEIAIRDYIERYAYPIKVRALLETFDSILQDVEGFTGSSLRELADLQDKLGKNENARREVDEKKKCAIEKRNALKKAKEKVEQQKKELREIYFDTTALGRARSDFEATIESDPTIYSIRHGTDSKSGLGSKSQYKAEEKIQAHATQVAKVMNEAIQGINDVIEKIAEKHNEQLKDIYGKLEAIVDEVEKSGVLQQGEYDFTNSLTWKTTFADMDYNKFVADMEKSIYRISRTEKVLNEEKIAMKNRGGWDAFKSLFMRKYVKEDVEYVYYDPTVLKKSIDEYRQTLVTETKNMEEMFKAQVKESTDKVNKMAEQLLTELSNFQKDIEKQSEEFYKLSKDRDQLEESISVKTKTHEWLKELEEKIKGE